MNTEPEKLFLFDSTEENDESKVVSIAELIKLPLKIPEYQRPYTWSADSVNVLFNDIKEALKGKKEEYRLGSVILCKGKDDDSDSEDSGKYLIVDGQQRLTTLAIMLYCLGDENQFGMLETKFSKLSKQAIQTNYAILQARINSLEEKNQKDEFKNFILNNCSVVKIVTDDEQAAFQFFDSQNSRGKALAPHDLLKAYHLREVGENIPRNEIIKLVRQWEDQQNKEENFGNLFATYLYPVVRWSQGEYGLNYNSKNIDTFKGIAPSKITKLKYNYAIYHNASNRFIEEMNRQITRTSDAAAQAESNSGRDIITYIHYKEVANRPLAKLIALVDRLSCWTRWMSEFKFDKKLNEFQLTQPLVAGLSFFEFTLHYQKLVNEIKDKIDEYHKEKPGELGSGRTGDDYVRHLYECVLLALADRFSSKAITKETMKWVYRWCYTLRLAMYSLYPTTVNNYALGYHNDRLKTDIPLFKLIREMNTIDDLFKYLNISSVPPVSTKDGSVFPGNEGEKRYKIMFERLCKEDEK